MSSCGKTAIVNDAPELRSLGTNLVAFGTSESSEQLRNIVDPFDRFTEELFSESLHL